MPAATTHVEFAKDVYYYLPEEDCRKITNRQMYYLGSQGPDLLFFSRASVLPGSLKKYGNIMHDIKVKEVIRCFEEYAGDDPDLRSYICGYLCHYALDSAAHPLICALARHNHLTTGIHEGESHVSMEAEIDAWMLRQRGRSEKDYNVWKYLKVSRKDAAKLADMLKHMLETVFGADISAGALRQAIYEVSFWTKFLYPRTVTYHFIRTFENLTKMPHSLSGMMLYRKNSLTVINLDHKEYPSRLDSSVMIRSSFPELYGRAVLSAAALIRRHDDSDFELNFSGEPCRDGTH